MFPTNKYLRNIKPYRTVSQKIWSLNENEFKTALKLDWNESTEEPSPLVRKRIFDYLSKNKFFRFYPALENDELLSKLANYTMVPKENILYFSSSDTAHEYIAKTYISPGDKILILWPSYDNFRLTAEINGGQICYSFLGESNLFNIEKFEEDIQKYYPSYVYLCNPNNPTGGQISIYDVESLLACFPNILFLVDEAYSEFSGITANELVLRYDNLIISHTMSKAFGLANFRFGYVVSAASNIAYISRFRNPKNIPTLTQVAVIAALDDIPHMKSYVDAVKEARGWFTNQLQTITFRRYLEVYPSSGNFVLIRCKNKQIKNKLHSELTERNIFVREMTQRSLSELYLRITIGTMEQMRRVYEAMKGILDDTGRQDKLDKEKRVDKNYCMSSYLVFRCIVNDGKEFYEGLHHFKDIEFPEDKKTTVYTAKDIGNFYKQAFESMNDVKLGIFLSGGMDSACLAAFMKPKSDAYTFRFLGGKYRGDDLKRAEQFASAYNLKLHYVDIDWDIIEKHIDFLMIQKGQPIHAIEPQVMEGALQAKKDGIEMMVIADGSDLVFGGMDKMLSKDWDYDEWIDFFTFCNPYDVLNDPVSMDHIFAPYKMPNNKIDYLKFIEEIFSHESNGVFCNACIAAGMKYTPYFDPSSMVKMGKPLDLQRVRQGESKYLIRELFKMCYPDFDVPEKVPMPRPVDFYFQDWKGPTRPEFKKNLDMSSFTGNQKWQIYCLERFLNLNEGVKQK